MPKSRWKSSGSLDENQDFLVLASSIPTKRISSALPMFRGSRIVHRQLASTPGLIGYSLLARPLRNEYATLSVWTGEDALAAFVAEPPHAELMKALAPHMGPTKFERWVLTGADGLPTWADALERLG